MTEDGSYHVKSFSTSTEAEIRRLNAQVDLFWATESELLARYGLRDSMDLLDCGCGPGRLIELLKKKMPELRCTGLEMDPILVEAAGQRFAECGLRGCRIVQGTAEKPGLTEASFDFIILRLVLEHVPDPALALRSLSRLLRPGGRMAVIANDFEYHLRTWPPVPQLERLYEAYRASRKKDGGDPCIGRRLPQMLTQAGLAMLGFELEAAHNAVLGDGPFLKAEGAGIPVKLVQTGFLDELTLAEMTQAWLAMLAEPGHSIVRQLFVGIGERPTTGADTAEAFRAPAAAVQQAQATAGPSAPAAVTGLPEGSLELILVLVSEALERDRVEPGDSLADLGMDSLSAMTLQDQILNRTGVEIPIVKLLENLPVAELARQLDVERATRQNRPNAQQSETGPETAPTWVDGEI
jgi:ubiquinone/menaquinone biosynthesis C-methylase UbiE/acyl carrier protein